MPTDLRAKALTRVSEFAEKWTTRLSAIYVEGVEVTQGLQYRGAEDHLTDPADRGADNSLTLVADKPAVVRVYVRTLLVPVADVTGTITVQRMRYGVWVDSGTLAQQFPGTITARADPTYSSERGSRANSLQFALPGSLLRGGALRLKVQVHEQGHPDVSAETSVTVAPSYRQTLRLRGIPVRYWGPDAAGNQIRVDAPTLADFQAETAWTLTAWPVSPTPDITLAGTFTQNSPLTGNIVGGACPQSWLDLLFWLGIARVIDGNDSTRLYYALMPTAIPIGNAGGCGGGGAGVGAGFVGGNGGVTMAHELGHVLGFSHAPCNLTAGDPNDPSYPAYEPYDSPNNRRASIGEYGYDVTTDSILSPATTADFMSYCPNTWVSLYHFAQLVPNSRLDPQAPHAPRDTLPPYDVEVPVKWPPDPPEPPWNGFVRPGEREGIIVIGGRIRDDEVDVRLVLRVDAVAQPAGRRVAGLQAELLGREGEILARGPVYRLAAQAGCGCGGHCGEQGDEPAEGLLEAMLPDPAARGEHPGTTLRIARDGTELWRRDAPDRPPTVGEVDAVVDGDVIRIRWQTDAAQGARVDRFVRWSADAGRSWQLLAAGLTADEAEIDVRTMTSGPVLVQPLVTDGFHTVTCQPARLEVEARPPEVAVLWPARGATVRAGQPVRLWGMATASDGRTIPSEDLHWELDGERLEPGGDVRVMLAPWEGEHVAVLHARDGDQRAEVRVVFQATGSGQAARRPEGG